MNWAAVAAAPVAPAAPADSSAAPKPRVAVVDANALITQHGLLNLARFADKAVTTPEVRRASLECSPRTAGGQGARVERPGCARCLACAAASLSNLARSCRRHLQVLREVRDKQSRATLAALPFVIETQEPDEEQVKAGEWQPSALLPGCCPAQRHCWVARSGRDSEEADCSSFGSLIRAACRGLPLLGEKGEGRMVRRVAAAAPPFRERRRGAHRAPHGGRPRGDAPPAVVKFARATGDIHALSSADVRLIALTRGLEAAAHGDGRLHELPQLPKVQKKKVHDAKQVGAAAVGERRCCARCACFPCRPLHGSVHAVHAGAPHLLHVPVSSAARWHRA